MTPTDLVRLSSAGIDIRCDLRPGDVGAIVALHGATYSREYGFDVTFEAYVAGPLAAFVLSQTIQDRIWIAQRDGRLAGCVAIVAHRTAVGAPSTLATPPANDRNPAMDAQLRWFLVAPEARDVGLGTILLREAVAFAREHYRGTLFLWTVSALTRAAALYRAVGMEKVEERPGRLWGVDVVEEKYALRLREV